MKKLNQKGFGVVEVLLVLVTLVLIGGVGYYILNNKKSSDKTSDTAPSSDTASVQESDQNYLVIKEWEVRFVKPDGLNDITYDIGDCAVMISGKETKYQCAQLDSPTLEANGTLKASGPESQDKMGTISRTPPGLKTGMDGETTYDARTGAKELAGYVYSYDNTHTTDKFHNTPYYKALSENIAAIKIAD